LELRNLKKRYGDVDAVRGVNLAVPEGEFLTVLGPSGSGKTTVLRLIAGFTEPSEGQVLIGGRDISHMAPAERGIGMVPQGYALFPHLSAGDNVGYGLKIRGWDKVRRRLRVEEMLELVGLQGMADRLPRELSGGQQQRVAVARALAFDPSLLLMDEPLGALDRELRVRMAAELRRIHSELGTTVVYVTHDREEALTLSDRIAVMHSGGLEAVDTPQGLYDRPTSGFVASFFGAHNLLPALALESAARREPGAGPNSVAIECFGKRASVRSWSELRHGEPARLAVPATAVSFRASDGGLPVTVRVIDSLYFGESFQVSCVLEDETRLKVEAPARDGMALVPGTRTEAWIDLSRAVAVT
jgi:putative spermidine/putrescine transport system ATP-binding protein